MDDEEVRQALLDRFGAGRAEAMHRLLKAAASYSEGDALAGAKLSKLTGEDYETITRALREAGLDASINNRMALVGFVSSPETGDEALDAAIKSL